MCHRIIYFFQYKINKYNSLNIKLSNSQLNKLKSAIKNETEIVLRLSSNMTPNSDDETNLTYGLLLTNRQVTNLRKLLQIIHQLISSYQKLNYLR